MQNNVLPCQGHGMQGEDKLYLIKMIYVVIIARLVFFTFSLLSGEEEARACEEEGADSQSQDLRAQCEEEGMTEECEEEVEALESGSDRRSSGKTDLTLDQKTFLIIQKSVNAKYPYIVKAWSARFTRRPPARSTVKRVLKRAREDNSIQSRKSKSGSQPVINLTRIV